jgi:effector-binding domain-containing protein
MSFLRLGALIAFGILTAIGPAAAQPAPAPAPPPATPAQPKAAQLTDPFGEEVKLTAKTIVVVKGAATWDTAFDTLVGSFKTVLAALAKQGIKPSGPPMTIYTATDDTGFEFMAGFPVAEAPKSPLPPEVTVATSPEGRALKFIHRGTYDSIDATYDKITQHFEAKKLEAGDSFVEQYVTDPLTTPEENLVLEIYMPVK